MVTKAIRGNFLLLSRMGINWLDRYKIASQYTPLISRSNTPKPNLPGIEQTTFTVHRSTSHLSAMSLPLQTLNLPLPLHRRPRQKEIQFARPTLRMLILRQLLQQTQKRIFLQIPRFTSPRMRAACLRLASRRESCACSTGMNRVLCPAQIGVGCVEGEGRVLRVGGRGWGDG